MDFTLRDENGDKQEIAASSLDEAREQAKAWVLGGNWNEPESTIWVRVRIEDEGGEDVDRVTVAINPIEPTCPGYAEHDWSSPYEIVGGVKENPGVHGHGGGVIITEVCMQCGCKRTTDTWAQDRSTGEQGLESVEYERVAYSAEELAAVRQ